MWLCKAIKPEELPKWATVKSDKIELSNYRYKYWKKQGWVEGFYQFKIIRKHKFCKECGEWRWVNVKLFKKKNGEYQSLTEKD